MQQIRSQARCLCVHLSVMGLVDVTNRLRIAARLCFRTMYIRCLSKIRGPFFLVRWWWWISISTKVICKARHFASIHVHVTFFNSRHVSSRLCRPRRKFAHDCGSKQQQIAIVIRLGLLYNQQNQQLRLGNQIYAQLNLSLYVSNDRREQSGPLVSIGDQGNLEAIRITKDPITSRRFSIKAQRSFLQAFATRGFSATTEVAAVAQHIHPCQTISRIILCREARLERKKSQNNAMLRTRQDAKNSLHRSLYIT